MSVQSSLSLAVALLLTGGCGAERDDAASVQEADADSSAQNLASNGSACFIGDPNAAAVITLVTRADDGGLAALSAGDAPAVPLVVAPQGGRVVLVGVRAQNVPCVLQLSAGLFDVDADGAHVIGHEGRPISLDSAGEPVDPETMGNVANIPVCPNFIATHDGDATAFDLEVRVTEPLREGEREARVHTLRARVTPMCVAINDDVDDCRCECDADFTLEQTRDDQCPTINANDPQ